MEGRGDGRRARLGGMCMLSGRGGGRYVVFRTGGGFEEGAGGNGRLPFEGATGWVVVGEEGGKMDAARRERA